MTNRRFETVAVHGGADVDGETGALAPPLHLSTTFERGVDGNYRQGFSYARADNPNRRALERLLAELEGGAEAAAFASGSAAAGAVFRSLRPGDHALAPREMYHGIRGLLLQTYVPWGLDLEFVDMTDLAAVEAALRPRTRLVWLETPSNPRLGVTDLAAVAALAAGTGAVVACDNTWTPPPLQPAFALGIDLVVHATTKYLAGHSDVTGGVVVARERGGLFDRIRFLQQNEGAVPSPFDCWLSMRGIRTLPVRIRAQQEAAAALARLLDGHPRVERVNYPGLPGHPGHDVARRQMRGYGAMLSFEMVGGAGAALEVAARLELITRATSLGGVETLIEHRASVEGPDSPTPDNLLRLSVGLEHPDDLAADLERALG